MGGLAWITGAGGLIGSHIVRSAPPEWEACALTRQNLNSLISPRSEKRLSATNRSSSFTAPRSAKLWCANATPKQARLNNIEVTRALTELAADIPLFFFSTDLVFDGAKGNYTEADAPNPLTVYAETKVGGGAESCCANPRHTVIRTSLNAGRTSNGTAFNEQWRAAWQRGESLSLFVDEFRSPIAAEVTARAVWELAAARPARPLSPGGQRTLVAL